MCISVLQQNVVFPSRFYRGYLHLNRPNGDRMAVEETSLIREITWLRSKATVVHLLTF